MRGQVSHLSCFDQTSIDACADLAAMAERDESEISIILARAEVLLGRIERAKRYAASMTNDTERRKFEAMVFDFERELASIQMHGFSRDDQNESPRDA